MKKYKVALSRTRYEVAEVAVEAESHREAKQKALAQVRGIEWEYDNDSFDVICAQEEADE